MLQGFQFDKMQAYPTTDASLFSYLAGDRSFIIPNRGNELNVTTSELNITVDTGEALILGRQIKITEPMVLTVGANQSGYLVIEIDLSKANTSTGTPGQPDYEPINNQLSLKFVNNLTQDNINDGGLIYQFNLGTVSSTSNNITFNKASNIMGGVYRKQLFQGSILNGTITLSDKITNYRFLVIGFNLADQSVSNSSKAIFPVLYEKNAYQDFINAREVVPEDQRTIVTYTGTLQYIDETTLNIYRKIINLYHIGNSSHSGTNEFEIKEIWGIR